MIFTLGGLLGFGGKGAWWCPVGWKFNGLDMKGASALARMFL